MKYKRGITFGAFELFHIGHLNILRRAKAMCEKLIVCVSDDEYIRKVKKHEPIIRFKDRKKVLESIEYIDEVSPQSYSFGKAAAVKKYKPDVIFVGDDWKGKDWDGAKLGIPVIYFPYTKGISTTKIKKKIRKGERRD